MKNLFKALSQFQQEVGSVKKDSKNPFLKNKYSSLDEMIKHCSPVLTKNGLSIIQLVSDNGVNTLLCHESGESIETGSKMMPVQVSKGLSHGQAEGVIITYTRRYQYAGILNLSTDEDTDGQLGNNTGLTRSAPRPVAKQDVKDWVALLDAVANGKVTKEVILKGYNLTKEEIEKVNAIELIKK
jgi:hypothetical protein